MSNAIPKTKTFSAIYRRFSEQPSASWTLTPDTWRSVLWLVSHFHPACVCARAHTHKHTHTPFLHPNPPPFQDQILFPPTNSSPKHDGCQYCPQICLFFPYTPSLKPPGSTTGPFKGPMFLHRGVVFYGPPQCRHVTEGVFQFQKNHNQTRSQQPDVISKTTEAHKYTYILHTHTTVFFQMFLQGDALQRMDTSKYSVIFRCIHPFYIPPWRRPHKWPKNLGNMWCVYSIHSYMFVCLVSGFGTTFRSQSLAVL